MTRLILAALTVAAAAVYMLGRTSKRRAPGPASPEPDEYVPMAAWLPQSVTVSEAGGSVAVKAHDSWRN